MYIYNIKVLISKRSAASHIGKTTGFGSAAGYLASQVPLNIAKVLIDAVCYVFSKSAKCDQYVSQTSFFERNCKPRLIDLSWYFCHIFLNFGQEY